MTCAFPQTTVTGSEAATESSSVSHGLWEWPWFSKQIAALPADSPLVVNNVLMAAVRRRIYNIQCSTLCHTLLPLWRHILNCGSKVSGEGDALKNLMPGAECTGSHTEVIKEGGSSTSFAWEPFQKYLWGGPEFLKFSTRWRRHRAQC